METASNTNNKVLGDMAPGAACGAVDLVGHFCTLPLLEMNRTAAQCMGRFHERFAERWVRMHRI